MNIFVITCNYHEAYVCFYKTLYYLESRDKKAIEKVFGKPRLRIDLYSGTSWNFIHSDAVLTRLRGANINKLILCPQIDLTRNETLSIQACFLSKCNTVEITYMDPLEYIDEFFSP
jgi:hypothetical protein